MSRPIDAFDRPAASAAGDVGREGTSGAAARADHVHPRTADTGIVAGSNVSFVAAATTNQIGGGTEAIITVPAGLLADDVVLWITGGDGTVANPFGIEVDEGQANAGNYYSYGWYRLTSSDLSGTWTFTGADVIAVAIYRGVVGTPSFASTTKITTLSATSVTMPAISGLASTDLEVRLLRTASNGDPTITITSGATQRASKTASIYWCAAIADAAPSSGTAAAVGASWSGSSDYAYTSVTLHGQPAGNLSGADSDISASAAGDVGSAGSSTFGAKADHKHDRQTDERVNTVTSAGSAQTLPATSTIHYLTLTANLTLTFPAAVAGRSFTVVLKQDSTARTVTWPGTVQWPGGTAPTLTSTSAKRDMFTFVCVDGTNWLGVTAAQNL